MTGALLDVGEWLPLAAVREGAGTVLDGPGAAFDLLAEATGEDAHAVARAAEGEGPRPDWWVGALFPGDCSELADWFPWQAGGRPLSYPVRHLPGRRTLLLAERCLGEAARPVLDAWRSLWAGACDPDALDALRRVTRAVQEERDEREGRARGVVALSRGGAGRSVVRAVLEDPCANPPRGGPVRDPGYHVLEDAAVHLALVSAGVAFTLDLPLPDDPTWRFGPDGKGGLRRLLPEEPAARSAPSDLEAQAKLVPYWRSRAFRDRAGRGMAVADGSEALGAILLDMVRQGHRKAFLKAMSQKAGTWTVDLAGVEGADAALARACAALGPDIGLLFGGPARRAMLVQAHVPFLREHRFLAVGHRVVASTASVRTLSVLDRVPGRLVQPLAAELRLPAGEPGAYDRGEQATVADRGLVARMAAGARDLARALGREGLCADLYCIDMGETADGRVLPIELNSFVMSGLYAMDYDRVARSLARRAAGKPDPRAQEAAGWAGKSREAGEPAAGHPLDRVAGRFVRWALGRREDGCFGFREAHEGEIAGYLRDAFRVEEREALGPAVAAFDPRLHPEWHARYVGWLRALARGRATAALRDLALACSVPHGHLVAWCRVPAGRLGADGEGWGEVPCGMTLARPPGGAGLLFEVEVPPSAVDTWTSVAERVCAPDPDAAALWLRTGEEVLLLSVTDLESGARLTAPGWSRAAKALP